MRLWLIAVAAFFFLAAPAEARWREASTHHFLIYSEESAESLKSYAEKLERYDRAMRRLQGLEVIPLSPSNRLTIYVLAGPPAVQRVFGKGGRDVAGFYMPRASGSVAFTSRTRDAGPLELNAQIILLHEYAHHFMMQNFPGAYPAWYVEGFAEFYSTTKFEKDGSLGFGIPANHRAYSLLGRYRLPIEDLVGGTNRKLNAEETGLLYGRGWLLTHYLFFSKERRGQLGTYLKSINAGKPALASAEEAFGDLKQLDRDLDKYLNRPTIQYLKLPWKDIASGPIAVRELSAPEDAIMDLKIRSRRGVDEKQARALLPLIRKAASPFPNHSMVQATLAEAEYDADNYAEADAAASRALAADPKNVDALLYKGRARLALARAANATDPKVWSEARRWFVSANKLDPDDPEPLILFYESFGEAGREPTANAVTGLHAAYGLAPHDPGLRMTAAMEYLRKKDTAEARFALKPIAFNPHGGEFGEVAAKVLATLDSKGPEAAFVEMQAAAPKQASGN